MNTTTITKPATVAVKPVHSAVLEGKIVLPEKEWNPKYSMMTRKAYAFPFTNKEEYLAWVKIWKDTYKALSLSIREKKMLRNNSYRTGDTGTFDIGRSAAYHVTLHKEEARTLLEIRRDGKVLAGNQRLANKQA